MSIIITPNMPNFSNLVQDLLPGTTDTYKVGTYDKRWLYAWFKFLNVGQHVTSHLVPVSSDYDIGDETNWWRNAYLLKLFALEVASNLPPTYTGMFDLGDSFKHWRSLYVNAIRATPDFPDGFKFKGVTVNSQLVVKDHTWEGDNTNDRVIDLGDDYNLILIFLDESKAENVNHLALAYAFKTVYGSFFEDSTGVRTQHESTAAANAGWQGKMTGADVNKIKLGSNGSANYGTNYLNYTYRLLGLKFVSA